MVNKIIIAVLFTTTNVYGQYIKFDNRLTFSSFYNKEKLPILSTNKVVNYSFMVGADYLQKKWFYLSSQAGYMNIGGKETNLSLQENNVNVSERRDYIHLNTTFRAYASVSGLKIFAGIGPYVNILVGDKRFNSELYAPDYSFKTAYLGGKAELGVTQDVSRFRIGAIVDYLYNFSPSAASQYISLNNNTFSGAITLGYRIQK